MSLRLPSVSLPKVSLPNVSLPKLPRLPGLDDARELVPHGKYIAAQRPPASELARGKAALDAKYAGTPNEGRYPLRVITFNTAVGNEKIRTNQADFPKLPFYRDVIEGRPDAPILALQEVGPAQAAELTRLAKNGKFSVLFADARAQQGNALLIPNRYEVVSQRSKLLGEGHVKGVAQSIWNKLHGDSWDAGQLVDPRMFSEAQLVDRYTGKKLTVFNTHLSGFDPMKEPQARQLFDEVKKAQARGPVIVAGDLNVAAGSTRPTSARIQQMFGTLEDMGNPGSPGKRTNIDWVLADGFEKGTSRWYLGDSLSLPGAPNAETVSDHYAEEDVFAFR